MTMRKIQPESMDEAYGPMMDTKSAEKKVIYPTANFDQRTLPEAKDWKVGKIYRVTQDLRMTSQSQHTGRDGEERGNYSFDIIAVDTSAGEQKSGPKARYTGK
jgi:hypothetical protein